MGVKIGAKVQVRADVVKEEGVLAITDETWVTGRGERWKKKGHERGGEHGVPMGDKNGVVHGFDRFVMCGEFSLGGWAMAYCKEDVSMFVDAWVIAGEPFDAADVLYVLVEEVEFEDA